MQDFYRHLEMSPLETNAYFAYNNIYEYYFI